MNSQKKIYLQTKDFSVSKEEFDLLYNPDFDMLETNPQPEEKHLGSYYESEDYLSHTDAKKSITDQMYQLVKRYTIAKKVKRIEGFDLKGKTILDIGCGTGDFLTACRKKGWSVCGIEPNQKARSLAQAKLDIYGENQLFESIASIEEKTFDVITMWHVLEHVSNLDSYILKIEKLLKPSGMLIVAVPNYKSYDASHYKKYWAAYDVPRHLWHFSKTSIKLLFEKVELKLLKIDPMVFDAFYVSLLSEKYKSGKNRFFNAFLIGLWSNIKAWKTKEYSSHIYTLKRPK